MGSRGRSIRLRIYFLVAIPLIAMIGLLAYVAGTSVNNAISVDRAPNLVNASGIPAAKFGSYVQSERAAAVVYLFAPTAANLQAYQAAITATNRAEPAFTAAMTSPAVVGSESPSGSKAIQGIIAGLRELAYPPRGGRGTGPQPAGRARRLQPGHDGHEQPVPDPDRKRGPH